MKRATALRNAHRIAERVRGVNGILATPGCDRSAVRIKRVWIFGSTIKGSPAPNDLDVLIECVGIGLSPAGQRRCDREYKRRYGMRSSVSCFLELRRWLRCGMQKVSVHFLDIEGSLASPRALIYPRWSIPE